MWRRQCDGGVAWLNIGRSFFVRLGPGQRLVALASKAEERPLSVSRFERSVDPRAASFNGNGRLRSRATVTRPITSPPSPPRSVFSKSRRKNTLFLRLYFPPRLLAGPYPTLLHRPPQLDAGPSINFPLPEPRPLFNPPPFCKSRGPCTRSSLQLQHRHAPAS